MNDVNSIRKGRMQKERFIIDIMIIPIPNNNKFGQAHYSIINHSQIQPSPNLP